MKKEAAREIISANLDWECIKKMTSHPILSRIARGRRRWENYVAANDGRPYRNSYACFLEGKLSNILIEAENACSEVSEIADGRNCVGANCCYSHGNRCDHPNDVASSKCPMIF